MNRILKGILLVYMLTGLFTCVETYAQSVVLNMPREAIIATLGEPETTYVKEYPESRAEYLFYGDDTFILVDGKLDYLSISSPRFALSLPGIEELRVGLPATLVTGKNAPDFAEDEFYVYKTFATKIGENKRIKVYVDNKTSRISGFVLEKAEKIEAFNKSEFTDFFNINFNPASEHPSNSLWPAAINVFWEKAVYGWAADSSAIACLAPFSGQLSASAGYSGKKCPDIAGRLVISRTNEGKESKFRQYMLSLVPEPGLSPGDGFSGLVVYNNANSGTTFAWEYYRDGRLVYSKFPTSKTPVNNSEINLSVRCAQYLTYLGGEDGISDIDWIVLASNRMNMTQSVKKLFPQGWNENSVVNERQKFAFYASPNPDYVKPEPKKKDPEPEDAFAEEVAPPVEDLTDKVEDEKQPVIDEPLPGYFGKTDNLSSIIRPKTSPVSVRTENSTNKLVDSKVVISESTDYCDCTIKMFGSLYTVQTGTDRVCTVNGHYRYYWYRGKAVSKLNVKFPYALPVAPGTKVRLISDPRERHRSYAVMAKTGEPAFAMRAGIVCATEEESSILVYHKDGTFAAYMNVDGRCVFPGDIVNAGDKIGKCGGAKLTVSIFYLDSNILRESNYYPYTHLTPYFMVDGTAVKLSPGTEYVSFINDELITKEMSNGEKKRYLKGK